MLIDANDVSVCLKQFSVKTSGLNVFIFCLFELCCSSRLSGKPKELVIPLIAKNRWSRPGQAEGNGAVGAPGPDSVHSQAVRELIEGQSLRNPEIINLHEMSGRLRASFLRFQTPGGNSSSGRMVPSQRRS